MPELLACESSQLITITAGCELSTTLSFYFQYLTFAALFRAGSGAFSIAACSVAVQVSDTTMLNHITTLVAN